MQYDNQHTTKKLQELEDLSLPDLSQMSEHWQQMKELLHPEISPASRTQTTGKKYGWWMIAAFSVAALAFLIYVLGSSRQQHNISPVSESTGKLPDTTSTRNKPSITPHQQKLKKNAALSMSNAAPEPILRVRRSEINPVRTKGAINLHEKGVAGTANPHDTTRSKGPADTKQILTDFFSQLEKKAQRFVISNKRDTLINGEEGTSLLIPANTFDTADEVVISIKEFYSYQDIITNKLSTASDGRQLVTGGMLHIIATINGKEVNIQPGKSIRWFIPDTSSSMNQMQLFTGSAVRGNNHLPDGFFDQGARTRVNRDSVSKSATMEVNNWIPEANFFRQGYVEKKVKVLYIPNEPFKTKQRPKGQVGLFVISDNSKLNREQLQQELKEKYGYYKVKIKRLPKDNFLQKLTPGFLKNKDKTKLYNLGDSAWIPDYKARIYRLPVTDSVTYITGGNPFRNNRFIKPRFDNVDLTGLINRFSVDIGTLGWINCDRFYYDDRPKLNYVVNLEDTASSYYTVLVFDKIKSMMTGYTSGNSVQFQNVPQGESARVISIGIRNGKTMAATEDVILSTQPLGSLQFEDTDPAAFREQAALMDNKR